MLTYTDKDYYLNPCLELLDPSVPPTPVPEIPRRRVIPDTFINLPKGGVVFVDHGWRDGKDVLYKSRQITNPTWEDLLRCCDESIYTREDFHHVFLESLETLAVQEGVRYIRFSFGS